MWSVLGQSDWCRFKKRFICTLKKLFPSEATEKHKGCRSAQTNPDQGPTDAVPGCPGQLRNYYIWLLIVKIWIPVTINSQLCNWQVLWMNSYSEKNMANWQKSIIEVLKVAPKASANSHNRAGRKTPQSPNSSQPGWLKTFVQVHLYIVGLHNIKKSCNGNTKCLIWLFFYLHFLTCLSYSVTFSVYFLQCHLCLVWWLA